MPIIVYKTLNLTTVHAQVRRIVCDGCGGPFSYVVMETLTTQSTGLPIVSSDEGMRKAALNQALGKLRKIAKKKNRGAALCPHCKVYQRFMAGASFRKGLMWGLTLGLFLGAIAGALFNAFVLGGRLEFPVDAGIGAVLGMIVGGVLARTFSLSVGPHQDKEDARAMSDDRFREHLAQCAKENYDPALAWIFMLGYQHDAKMLLLSLGVEDRTDAPIAPPELLTDRVLAQLKN